MADEQEDYLDYDTTSGTTGDYFEIFVEKYATDSFTGQSSMNLSSYLRLGTADTDSGKSSRAKKYGDDLARKAVTFEDVTTGKGEDAVTTEQIKQVFIDDARDRSTESGDNSEPADGVVSEPADGVVSKPDRVKESQKLFSRGGWRDHSDGNRITTTRGDKIEVIRGNYKMMVLGRQDSAAYAASDDLSGGIAIDEDRVPGSFVAEWTTDEDGTWKHTETVKNGVRVLDYEGTNTESWSGDYEETYKNGSHTANIGEYVHGRVGGGITTITEGFYGTSLNEFKMAQAAILSAYTAPIIAETWSGLFFEVFAGNRFSVSFGFEENFSWGLALNVRMPFGFPAVTSIVSQIEVVIGDFYELATDEHFEISKTLWSLAYSGAEYIFDQKTFNVASTDFAADAKTYGFMIGLKALRTDIGA